MQKPTIFSFSDQFVKDHYRSGYQLANWMQKHTKHDHTTIPLENFYLALRERILNLLFQKNIINQPILLEDLHLYLTDELKTYGNDGLSKIAVLFYETNAEFKNLLYQFIYEILYQKIIKKPFFFQATPTFRIHCPHSKNSEFFPHYHTDLALGHPPHEINLWIPLTEARDGHGFYLASLAESRKIANYIDYDLPTIMDESVYRDKNYLAFCEPKLIPVAVDAGHALVFDGRCFHTAMPVQDHTRISIDFRIVLQEDFDQANIIYENRGLRRRLCLVPNDYYHFAHSAELQS